ncbi:outer membrane protein OmpK [Pseudomonas kuykendallii]|uniref:outer membrane protein OmpK n=1 Tax=Pseudomonas kuykendallii TaxID=1007099 RepID=UPI0028D859DD|nr:outer membrane protein OmpK [Pseudomonas kuykendallii]
MKRTLTSLIVAGGLLAAGQAMADGPLLWQGNSLTYLNGHNYKIDAPIQQTVTFEHASGWTWGDIFFFVDSIHFNGKGNDNGNDDSTLYGEFSPRLSLGKLTGKDFSFGPVSDVLLAMTYEFGEGDNESYLYGPGFDLKIPGFDYFQLNFYYRQPDGDRVPDGAIQITPAWSYTLPVGDSDILIDGFMDWVVNNKEAGSNHPEQSDYHANLHFNPQIKYDLGKALNWGEKQFYVGIEYDYWSNKYGIRDGGFVSENFVGKTDQNTYSVIAKVNF